MFLPLIREELLSSTYIDAKNELGVPRAILLFVRLKAVVGQCPVNALTRSYASALERNQMRRDRRGMKARKNTIELWLRKSNFGVC